MNCLTFLTVFSLLLISIVSSGNINKRQTNDIEKLLEQLANANNNNNVKNNNGNQNKDPESPVRNALRDLLSAYQQVRQQRVLWSY